MNMHVVGERKLLEAFELIGIRGHAPSQTADVAGLVRQLAEREGARVVLVQSKFIAHISEEELDRLARAFGCVVIEVPAVNQPAPDAGRFRRQIETAMGASM